MPKIICPLCEKGYLKFVKKKIEYKRTILKIYKCKNCGEVRRHMPSGVITKSKTFTFPPVDKPPENMVWSEPPDPWEDD